ncbi:ABC transporter permease subunit, partial [bacterium]|nr:ABC transporter permease subunit [bacterium]
RMSDKQVLSKVELPLAIPTIFAGIQTSAVLNVGLVTICALVGAGGLGELIFQGIQLNNQNLILAGAIPAALLALALDLILNAIQKRIHQWFKTFVLTTLVILAVTLIGTALYQMGTLSPGKNSLRVALPQEFVGRALDGYRPFMRHYGFGFEYSAMDPALMYIALRDSKVDIICGYTTDGRIKAFDLVVLDDDQNFFPPYHCAYLLRNDALSRYPQLDEILKKVQGKLTDDVMTALNYRVDFIHESPRQVARS